jgi:hypothetical protein
MKPPHPSGWSSLLSADAIVSEQYSFTPYDNFATYQLAFREVIVPLTQVGNVAGFVRPSVKTTYLPCHILRGDFTVFDLIHTVES